MSVEDYFKNIKQMMIEDLDRSKNTVYSGLVESIEVNKMPESVFVNYFLPCFIGQSNNPIWVSEWISISGSASAEIDVVDDTTREILFRVPGIFNTSNIIMNSETGSLSDIFYRYNQISNNIPSMGVNFLVKALGSKRNEMLNEYSNERDVTRWKAILTRYNLNPDTTTNDVVEDSLFE